MEIEDMVDEILHNEGEFNKEKKPESIKVYRSGGSITLTKTSTGKYGWEVKFNAEDVDSLFDKVDKINRQLEARYGMGNQ